MTPGFDLHGETEREEMDISTRQLLQLDKDKTYNELPTLSPLPIAQINKV
jgi:hypothetical protein